jgi:hypothetical protein
MRIVSFKAILPVAWIITVLVAGLASNLHSLSSWSLLAGFAIVPPILMMRRWNGPDQTLSESIQQARR